MKSVFAAIAFLTRVPVPGASGFNGDDVARAAKWFPFVGVLLGGVYSLAAFLLKNHLPAGVVAVLLVLLDVMFTGALHFDGLADTADGFGGGRNIEDILRIMRDHVIGSYGGVAMAILVALKVTSYAVILEHSNWLPALLVTPALGRWSILLLTATLPYARSSPSAISGMGRLSLLWGTCVIAAATAAAMSARGLIAIVAVMFVSALFGFYCKRKIGGITGDTLGANLQLCESAVLLVYVWV